MFAVAVVVAIVVHLVQDCDSQGGSAEHGVQDAGSDHGIAPGDDVALTAGHLSEFSLLLLVATLAAAPPPQRYRDVRALVGTGLS